MSQCHQFELVGQHDGERRWECRFQKRLRWFGVCVSSRGRRVHGRGRSIVYCLVHGLRLGVLVQAGDGGR